VEKPRSRSPNKSPVQTVPEPVQDLKVTQDDNATHPSVTLSWKPPANCRSSKEIIRYCIMVSSKIGSAVLKQVEVAGDVMEMNFDNENSLEPLQGYIFAVQAVDNKHTHGDWNMIDGFVGK